MASMVRRSHGSPHRGLDLQMFKTHLKFIKLKIRVSSQSTKVQENCGIFSLKFNLFVYWCFESD